MSPTAKMLGVDRMSVAERIILAEEIWESVAEDVEAQPLTDAQREELDRRLADHAENPQAGSTWEAVKARLLGKK